ncbi:MAG: ribonuclease R family protein, partial [Burkholderiaceae bacterium]
MVNTKINRTDSDSIVTTLTAARAPLSPADLAERLQIADDGHGAFNAQLEELERAGRIVRNRAGLLLVAARANLLSGQVQGHRDGFGFLIRDDGGADLVLSEHEMAKVLHGDRVLARITGADRRGRPEGEIVEVIESRTNKLVGRLLNERGVAIVVPEDQRIQHDILVPPGASLSAEPGQVVVVEILQQPQRYVQPVGRVVEVLGAIDDPGMEIEIAVRKYEVPHRFSPETVAQTAKLPDAIRPVDRRHRIDLTDVPLVTIDGEDARDFDDAVYCEPHKSGRGKNAFAGWRLVVAIADVSHYVKPDEPLDEDAYERATSVYFPRRVIPMLPEKLSNGLCSLNPDEDRLAMACDMLIAADGEIHAYQLFPALI